MKNKKGFTFIETLIVVGVITLLATTVVVTVNPVKIFEEARNRQREIHLQTILNAIEQKRTLEGGWFGVNCGSLPSAGEEGEEEIIPFFKTIGTKAEEDPENFYNLFPCLVPKYMPNPLYDPEEGDATDTKYQIWQNPQTKYITLCYEKDEPYKRFCAGAETYRILSEPKGVETAAPVTSIGHYTAIGGGTVYDDGGSYISEAGLIWAEDSKFTGIDEAREKMKYEFVDMNEMLRSVAAEGGTAVFSFNSDIHDLQGGQTGYYVRAYAKNEIGVGYGDIVWFETLDGRPDVQTSLPEEGDTGYDTAVIRGVIETLGDETVEKVGRAFFCWNDIDEPDGEQGYCPHETVENIEDIYNAPYYFYILIGSLDVGVTYHFQACGENIHGIRCGEIRDFTTAYSAPFLETLGVNEEDIGVYSTRVGGSVTSNGGSLITERGVCFSVSDPNPCYDPTVYPDQCEAATEIEGEIGNFFTDIPVEPGNNYSICAYASNTKGLAHGEPAKSFYVEPTAPEVTTKPEAEMVIGSSWAKSGGNIINNGGGTIEHYGVCWSLGDPMYDVLDPINDNNCVDREAEIEDEFTINIDAYENGLWANTIYNVRAYAINEIDIGWGDKDNPPVAFETSDATNPEVTTKYPPDDITMFSATLGGIITDHGGASVEMGETRVCWSMSSIDNDPQIGEEDVTCPGKWPVRNNLGEFTIEVTGLYPDTSYHYQAYVKNSAGFEDYGGAQGFRTETLDPPMVATYRVEESNLMVQGEPELHWVNISGWVFRGGYSGTRRGICYGEDEFPTCIYAETTGIGFYPVVIENLATGTEYYAYAFAYNTLEDWQYGNSISFEVATCKYWASGDHLNIDDETDPRDECDEEWTSCDGLCARIGEPGYCDGGGACSGATIVSIESGHVCTGSGEEIDVSTTPGTYCNTEDVCVAGSCSGTRYYTSCNSTGSCRGATDHTDSATTSIYASPGKVFNSTCGNQDSTASIKCADMVCVRSNNNCSGTKKYPECQAGGVCDSSATTYYTSLTVTALANHTLTTNCGDGGVNNCGTCKWCQSGSCNNEFYDSRNTPTKIATVQIGTQCWMKQNMNVGDRINGGVSQGDDCSPYTDINKYCWLNGISYCYGTVNPTYPDGGLYTWYQAMCGSSSEGSKGICPSGWHIPTDAEGGELVYSVSGGCENSMAWGWNCAPAGTNLKPGGSSYFNANLTGEATPYPNYFYYRGEYGWFWTSTTYPSSTSQAFYREVSSLNDEVRKSAQSKTYAFPVRCIKDL